jgi:hypothetical protein
MFCLIALIGTGWQFVKPFLTDNDKVNFVFPFLVFLKKKI